MSDTLRDGRIELYGTATGGFDTVCMHPIVEQEALTALEQSVEAELRRRGHKFTDRVGVSRLSHAQVRYTAGNWAITRLGYQPKREHLSMTTKQIADAIEKGEA